MAQRRVLFCGYVSQRHDSSQPGLDLDFYSVVACPLAFSFVQGGPLAVCDAEQAPVHDVILCARSLAIGLARTVFADLVKHQSVPSYVPWPNELCGGCSVRRAEAVNAHVRPIRKIQKGV
jgi:hypothetical protein